MFWYNLLLLLLLMKVMATKTSATVIAKEVIKVEMELLSTHTTCPLCTLPLSLLLNTFFSLLIVDASFFRIRQDLISIGNFLELCLSFLRVIPVFVWVVLDCLLLKSFFDLIIGCIRLDTHHFVIVVFWIFRLCFLLLLLLSLATTSSKASSELLTTLSSWTTHVKLKLLGCNPINYVRTSEDVISSKRSQKCKNWPYILQTLIFSPNLLLHCDFDS